MAVQTTESSRPYTLTGAGQSIPFDLPFDKAADLKLYLNGSLLDNAKYSVQDDGTIILNSDVGTNGDALIVKRVVALDQQRKFPQGGELPSEEIAGGLDKTVQIDQQLQEQIDRAHVLPEGYQGAGFPDPAADTYQAYDSSGDPVNRTHAQLLSDINLEIPDSVVDRPTTTFTNEAVRDVQAADFTGQVGYQLDLVDPDNILASMFVSQSTTAGDWVPIQSERSVPRKFSPYVRAKRKKAVIFQFDGQSNTVGFGTVTSYDSEDRAPGNLLQMSRGYTPTNQTSTYYEPTPAYTLMPGNQPLQAIVEAPGGLNFNGFPFYFLRLYALDHPDEDVIALVNAEGGINATAWATNGGYRWRGVQELDILYRQIKETYDNVRVGAIIYHQGENEARTTTTQVEFEGWVEPGLELARAECEKLGLGSPPILIGTLYENLSLEVSLDEVNAAIRNMPNLITNCGVFDNVSETDAPDGVHFGTTANRSIGARVYTVYKTLTESAESNVPLRKTLEVYGEDAKLVSNVPYDFSHGTRALVSTEGTMRFRDWIIYPDSGRHPKRFTQAGTFRITKQSWQSGADLVHLFSNAIHGDKARSGTFIYFKRSTGDLEVTDHTGTTVYVSAAVTPGYWHSVVVTFQDGVMKLYIDGTEEDSATLGFDTFDISRRYVSIGGNQGELIDTSSLAFPAEWAECTRFEQYDGVFTAEQADNWHLANLPSNQNQPSTLLASWEMADVTDSSGNGYDLTQVATVNFAAGVATFPGGGGGGYLTLPSDYPDPDQHVTVVRFRTNYNASSNLMFFPSGGGGFNGMSIDASGYFEHLSINSQHATVNDNNWHTAAISQIGDDINGYTRDLWIDGTFGGGEVGTVARNTGIKGDIGYGATRYQGDLDFFRVYTGFHNQEQVRQMSLLTT